MGEFRMPSLGADMEYGTLVEWLVKPGDIVKRGDVVAVVDTDKSTIDVEVFDTGVIDELLVEPGERVPVGALLARLTATAHVAGAVAIEARDESAARSLADAVDMPPLATRHVPLVTSPLVRHEAEVRHVDLDAVVGTGPGGRIMRHDVETAASGRDGIATAGDITPRRVPTGRRASPFARRLAAESGLDLLTLTGTGPTGAVVARDVRGAPLPIRIDERPAQPTDRAATMRQRISDVMSRAHRDIPQYHLTLSIDLDAALAALRDRNENHPPSDRILPAAALLHASAGALRDIPGFNGHYLDGTYRPADDVHLGVAVAMRGGGLIVPVIRNADRLDLATVMRTLHELVGRARAGRLRASDLADATATVTDLGDKSVDSVAGIIHPPQVALIGFGQIANRPAVVDGQVVVRPQLTATLTADHRVTDGHDGTRLLRAIDQRLQHWEDFDDT